MRAKDFELDEITGVKRFHHMSADDIIYQISEETGLRVLGQGSYGYVMESRDPNWVYKFFKKDPAYLNYLKFIVTNPNPHYPRIKSAPKMMRAFYTRYKFESNQYHVVLVEKLMPTSMHRDEELDFFEELAYYSLDHIPRTYAPPQSDQSNEGDYSFNDMAQSLPWIKTMHSALHDIRSAIPDTLDLHPANIMQRKDGTYVLVDPVADEAYSRSFYASTMKSYNANEPQYGGPEYNQKVVSDD